MVLAWFAHRSQREKEMLSGEEALEEAKRRLHLEEKILEEIRAFSARAKKSRERNGYGKALRKALGGSS